MSLLNDLRSKSNPIKDEVTEAYNRTLRECPPVSAALIAYLEKMFARRYIKPNEPMMQQELVYQAGVDKVIQHLRSQNERQEKEIKNPRT